MLSWSIDASWVSCLLIGFLGFRGISPSPALSRVVLGWPRCSTFTWASDAFLSVSPIHPLAQFASQPANHPLAHTTRPRTEARFCFAGPHTDARSDIGSTSVVHARCQPLRHDTPLHGSSPPCPPGAASARMSQSSQPAARLPTSSTSTSRRSSGGCSGAIKRRGHEVARAGRT